MLATKTNNLNDGKALTAVRQWSYTFKDLSVVLVE